MIVVSPSGLSGQSGNSQRFLKPDMLRFPLQSPLGGEKMPTSQIPYRQRGPAPSEGGQLRGPREGGISDLKNLISRPNYPPPDSGLNPHLSGPDGGGIHAMRSGPVHHQQHQQQQLRMMSPMTDPYNALPYFTSQRGQQQQPNFSEQHSRDSNDDLGNDTMTRLVTTVISFIFMFLYLVKC